MACPFRIASRPSGLLALLSISFGLAPIGSAQQRQLNVRAGRAQPIHLTWLGHAGFEVVSPGGTRLLIDPWLDGNGAAPAPYRDSARYARRETRPDAILVTHGHADHDGDVPRLARISGAPVLATGDHLEA